jgi:hypothetical protein
MSGKGSKRRPCFVSDKQFDENWSRAFDVDKRRSDKVRQKQESRSATPGNGQLEKEKLA